MPSFRYTARDASANRTSGELDAEDARDAARQLRERGLFPLEIVAASRTVDPHQVRAVLCPIPLPHMIVFFSSLAATLNAGMSPQRALDAISRDGSHRALRRIAAEMSKAAAEGRMMSDTMTRYPEAFSPVTIAIMKAGEASGMLADMARRNADLLTRMHQLSSRVRGAMIYPIIQLLALNFIPAIPILFVGGGLGPYLANTLPPLFMGIALVMGVVLAFRLTGRANVLRLLFDTIKSTLPGVAGVSRAAALARFCRVFGALYGAGVAPLTAVQSASDACGNLWMARRLHQAGPALQRGAGFADALNATGMMTPILSAMIRTGEETGKMDEMVIRVAELFEDQVDFRVRQSLVVGSVAVLLIIAIRIGLYVVNFYTSFFNDLMRFAE